LKLAIKSIRDPVEKKDGTRILISRYRPRGVRKGTESWREWDKRLAPSIALVDAWYGKKRVDRRVVSRDEPRLGFADYKRRFMREMQSEDAQAALRSLRERLEGGEAITLLCFCEDETKCHRSLVRALLLSATEVSPPASPDTGRRTR
jgi:uncharacterized protein YeaO (DUF488 family)